MLTLTDHGLNATIRLGARQTVSVTAGWSATLCTMTMLCRAQGLYVADVRLERAIDAMKGKERMMEKIEAGRNGLQLLMDVGGAVAEVLGLSSSTAYLAAAA